MFRVVIPARYASSRFPGKPLVEIAGRPMIHWVHECAVMSGAESVVVATDDERIAKASRAFGADVALTSPEHASGTDRIAEVAAARRWSDEDVVVNLQGDEPLMPPSLVSQVARTLERHSSAAIATVAAPIRSIGEFLDPNVVKVVLAADGRALYFSRAPIPWARDGASGGLATQSRYDGALRHVGLYAYRVSALRRLATLAPSPLEITEKLEQLRALENGLEIRVVAARERPGQDVNTPEDLARVAVELAARSESRVK